ncbi:MAG: ubiquitin-specific protease otu1 [Trizodia sp. TS-e1964]|nr:MAG: ubiquitin-specific protease otu1 [Trizodia sp. TS-e1964]
MRLKLRGPLGTSSITIDSASSVGELLKIIREKTSLEKFEVKYGYPPKPLRLDLQEQSKKLSLLDENLDGEFLTISKIDSAAAPSIKSPISAPLGDSQKSSAGSFSFASTSQKATSQLQQNITKPLSLKRKKPKDMETDPPEIPMPSHGATLVLRVMQDDNSCLFRAFGSAFLGSLDSMTELRSLVAQVIQAEPDTYTEVVLDQKPDDYCRWIQTEDAWGGGIELSILSKHFNVEICSIDVQTLRVDRFNEGCDSRCILVYSGIHYDTIAQSLSEPPYKHATAPLEFDIKVFDSSDNEILEKAIEICRTLKGRHYFTDTANFSVQCNVCGKKFVGEMGAVEHASKTGHQDFGEAS